MPVLTFRLDDLLADASAPAPVPAPLGEPVSQTRSRSIAAPGHPATRFGAWECSLGRWRRQVMQAEFCHVLAGDAVFTPDAGVPVRLRAGDVAYFPPDSGGVWDVAEHTRKVFIVFDERSAS